MPITYTLKDYYTRLRRNGAPAAKALRLARDNFNADRPLHQLPYKVHTLYNPQTESGGRWVENVSNSLRFIGFADKIANRGINHQGWLIDNICTGDVYRGVVYALPSRKGKSQFIYGYADPWNNDCAYLFFEPVDDKIQAAYSADKIAERYAEREREYSDAYHAGDRYANALDDIKKERAHCISLIQAIKIERKRGAAEIICQALREHLQGHLRAINNLREQRSKILDDYSHSWRKDVWSAFNEGAGFKAIG